MRPREQIIDLFSSFAQFEGDRFRQWISDPKLRRSMQQCLGDNAHSERVWSGYWYQCWHAQTHPFAEWHLSAFLQEPCYWATQRTIQRFQGFQYGVADYFQMASAETHKVLRGYNPERGASLRTYAAMALPNLLKDILRQRQDIDICTNWALLRKVSKKRVTEALVQNGLSGAEVDQYRFAWLCFKTLYVQTQLGGLERLPQPDRALWEAISQLYNAKRYQLVLAGTAWSAEQMEKRLSQVARWIRAYLYPAIASLNQPKSGEDATEWQDDLSAPESQSLLDELVMREELQQRSTQLAEMHNVLQQALQQLDSQSQTLLRLFYQEGLSQQQLAVQLQMSQPSISRRLKKAEAALLTALTQWIQTQVNEFPNPNQLKDISISLKEWLRTQYVDSTIPTSGGN
ncbi:sigma-70 family RNA polymerase sigma factor [Phormidesmis priestleyi]